MYKLNRRGARISDLRRALDAHLQSLPQEAPIRLVVASPDIQARLHQFDWADAIALRESRSYRRFRLLALWATMVATLVGAFSLLPLQEQLAAWQRSAIQVVQAAAVTLSFIATVWVGVRHSIRQWLQSRAVAERMRADVFRALMRTGTDTARGLLAPALACFRDAHLDWQLAFYRERAARYGQAANSFDPYKWAGYLLLAVAVAAGSLGILGIVAATYQAQWPMLQIVMQWVPLEHPERWQLGLGAMATSILAFATMRSFIGVDDRNASFYPMTAAALQTIRSASLADAEAAAASSDIGTAMAFCEAVQTILDDEHLAWTHTRPPEHPAPPWAGSRTGG